MKTTKITKKFIEIGNGKNIICFDPPAVGKLFRNILTGEYIIVEHNRVIPVPFEKGEKLIEINF